MEAVQNAGYSVPQHSLELSIDGMTCASCVGRVERALNKVPGVKSVSVNLANERPTSNCSARSIRNPARRRDQSRIQRQRLGGRTATNRPPAHSPAPRALGLLAAIALALPLVLPMLLQPFGVHWMLPAWVQFALATPVQFIFGARFYVAAWKAVRRGRQHGFAGRPGHQRRLWPESV
jgi:Cu+-exporting ATPase